MDRAVKGGGRPVRAELTPTLMKQLSRRFPCPKTEPGGFFTPGFRFDAYEESKRPRSFV